MTPRPAQTQSPWIRRAFWLVAATLAYNLVEAVVALWAGTEAESLALFGFGLDSVIELVAAGAVLWRLWVQLAGADVRRVERSESSVRRVVGVTFLALAAYVLAQAVLSLARHAAPEESPVGVALAVASLVIMPGLSMLKLRVARRMGSRALEAEAKETLACAYLSLALLLGLLATMLAGWWWIDAVAALVMTPWLIKEGVENIRGEEEDG